MSFTPSPIHCEVDLDADGKHNGFLRLPHSVHRSAYGWIPIPIVSIKNGEGPTAVLMAGNHGDEYEGQVALSALARDLDETRIQGQLIILPMANFPAAKAGTRTSPLDDGNLNRSFPGDPAGTPTKVIAHYVESELLNRADYLLDIHSGGSSLMYTPSALMTIDPMLDQHEANLALLRALGFPQALLFESDDKGSYSSSAAKRQDAIAVTLEVAGGGAITPSALVLLKSALQRYLHHIGVTADIDPQDLFGDESSKYTLRYQTGFFLVSGTDNYCYAYEEGLFEPIATLGDDVVAGQQVAQIHFPSTPWRTPEIVSVQAGGRIMSMRVPSMVQRGDCLYEIAMKAT